MVKPTLVVGNTYVSKQNDVVHIVAELTEGEPGYDQGFRFLDKNRNTYTPEGKWSVAKKSTDRDLVIKEPA